jgi:hypothetical protein
MVDIYSIMKQYGVISEPTQQSINLTDIKDQLVSNPSYLTPANFGEFVMSGSYRKVTLASAA